MSQENVEVVWRAFAEFERGNFWVREVFDPTVRVVWLDPIVLEGGQSETVGLEQFSTALKGWLESWDRVTMTAERLIDAGDQVVVVAVWRGRGKASGAATEWRHGQVWTIRGTLVTDVTSYSDPAEALKAAGLSE
jgi:ketosteroid isomerase-like protein